MLLEIAIGDAYGAGFEFSSRDKIAHGNDGVRYIAHDLGEIPAGHYTDDTQMSLAVCEALLAEEWTEAAFAERFVSVFRRDPRPGYAKGIQSLLAEVADGNELRRRIAPSSRRNGAAMRAVPLGFLPEMTWVLDAATANARVTHDTPEGILSSRCIAATAHLLAFEKSDLASLPESLQGILRYCPDIAWSGEVDCDAIQTISAALTLLLRERSELALLRACVDMGGDTDSVAAIALGLASLCREYQRDLPAGLLDGLENGPYGASFLKVTDTRLSNRFGIAPTARN